MPTYLVLDGPDLAGRFTSLPDARAARDELVEMFRADALESGDWDGARVTLCEVVSDHLPRVCLDAEGGEYTDVVDVAGPTEADALRRRVAELEDLLARFVTDSGRYQAGYEAARADALRAVDEEWQWAAGAGRRRLQDVRRKIEASGPHVRPEALAGGVPS